MKNKFLKDRVYVIETNIDDMNPVVYETAVKRLYKTGALEVFLAPVQMKKMRPGILMTVLSPKDKLEKITETIFRETTSFGIRYYEVDRLKLFRRRGVNKGKWGEIRENKGYIGKELVKVSPEYEDCRKLASRKKTPLKNIIRLRSGVYA